MSTGDVIIERDNCVGVIALNRPRARNALTWQMRRAIAAAYAPWAYPADIYCVLMKSTTPGMFCAGGDVKELAELHARNPAEFAEAARQEYAHNWALDCFRRCQIALIDGPVMGSGVGISQYGSHRVAGSAYRFAMPEVAIGFFPDVGASQLLAGLAHNVGMYLALSGHSIGRADAYRLGLVTHTIDERRFGDIQGALSEARPVDILLDGLQQDPGRAELAARLEAIEHCFGAESVAGILSRLRGLTGSDGDWGLQTAADIEANAPFSLAVTHQLLVRARDWDLREALINDCRLAVRLAARPDFGEGVRARLIDKDNAPNWQPASLQHVADSGVAAMFDPLPEGELELPARPEAPTVHAWE